MKRLFKKTKNNLRKIRHARIRSHMRGNVSCPRLSVFRSLKNIYAQLIDDDKAVTLCQAKGSEVEKKKVEGKNNKEATAYLVGQLLAKRAKEKNITKVIFDRGGYKFHGRVKSLADGARESGLQF